MQSIALIVIKKEHLPSISGRKVFEGISLIREELLSRNRQSRLSCRMTEDLC